MTTTTPAASLRASETMLVVLALFTLFFAALFAPVWLEGRLLAYGDALLAYLPALERAWAIWQPGILSGYPAFADPQMLTWYPLRLFDNYNGLVIAGYVLSATFVCGHLRAATGSTIAGLLGAFAVSLSGFWLAHLAHLTIVHSALWLPLALWALHRLRDAASPWWIGVASVAIALSCLGGHPQIFVYVCAIAFGYATVLAATPTDSRPATARLAVLYAPFVLGIALAAIQILPSAEFAALSLRATYSYQDFISYSLPVWQLPLLAFPALFGTSSPHAAAYFGDWNLAELASYAGVFTALFATVGAVRGVLRRDALVVFWIALALLALAFMLGPMTPLARVVFELPVVGKFRCPARASLVVIYALAFLAAHGFAALERGEASRRVVAGSALVFAVVGAIAATAVALQYPFLATRAAAEGVALPTFFANSTIWRVVIGGAVALLVLVLLHRARSRKVALLVVALSAIELVSWTPMYDHRYYGPARAALEISPPWRDIADDLSARHARLMPLAHRYLPTPETPTLNTLHGIRSVAGYGPLMPSWYAEATRIDSVGHWKDPARLPWLREALAVGWETGTAGRDLIGGACGGLEPPRRLVAEVPRGYVVAGLRLVSNLGCSVEVPQGRVVANVVVLGTGDEVRARWPVAAGVDTAEWAHGAPHVRDVVQHDPATIDEAIPADGFDGAWYESATILPVPVEDARAVEVEWNLDSSAFATLRALELRAPDGRTLQLSLRPAGDGAAGKAILIAHETLARRVDATSGPAWFVARAVVLDGEARQAAISRGTLPDGTHLSARETAVVSAPAPATAPGGSVRVEDASAGYWRFAVETDADRLLYVSEVDYPGWRATVDGENVPIVRANHAFIGVPIPRGARTVELEFEPASLRVGAAITSLAGAAMALLFLLRRGRRRTDLT